jgi:alkanesulfonate monooxygenase SsuD/methylene tetrahydromethanopterin reductase-like flavin-dependent oxidoreductase (luciferase family)
MECDYRQGRTQEQAFSEAFEIAEYAEEYGVDGVWLAERHFATHRRPGDPMGAGIPSVVSVPLVWAGAIAARTKHLRIGTGVSVLPLCHPIRLAEEAATVDQISQGRLEFGVGRSSFPRSYKGYGIPYDESRERFQENLEIITKAWSEDRLTYKGKYYSFEDLCVMPQPYQKPHPPIRIAATTPDTFSLIGKLGYPLVSSLRGIDVPDMESNLSMYRTSLIQEGHGQADSVYLRLPIYVGETDKEGVNDPQEGTMRSFRRLAENYAQSAGAGGTSESATRQARYERLANVTYDELLQDRLAYGSPDTVAKKLSFLIQTLGLSGVIMEPNVGGTLSESQVLNSIRLYASEVAPKLRD